MRPAVLGRSGHRRSALTEKSASGCPDAAGVECTFAEAQPCSQNDHVDDRKQRKTQSQLAACVVGARVFREAMFFDGETKSRKKVNIGGNSAKSRLDKQNAVIKAHKERAAREHERKRQHSSITLQVRRSLCPRAGSEQTKQLHPICWRICSVIQS